MVIRDLNIKIEGTNKRPILIDLMYSSSIESAPLIIFCHGYKGFKDWGAWPLLSTTLAASGFAVLKFNFSHNGGTHKQPIDFPDLEAFGNNNYTKELEDLDRVISWTQTNHSKNSNINPLNITLIGHSRGGGIVVLKAAEDSRVRKVVSLAGRKNSTGVPKYDIRIDLVAPSSKNYKNYLSALSDSLASRLCLMIKANSKMVPCNRF